MSLGDEAALNLDAHALQLNMVSQFGATGQTTTPDATSMFGGTPGSGKSRFNVDVGKSQFAIDMGKSSIGQVRRFRRKQ